MSDVWLAGEGLRHPRQRNGSRMLDPRQNCCSRSRKVFLTRDAYRHWRTALAAVGCRATGRRTRAAECRPNTREQSSHSLPLNKCKSAPRCMTRNQDPETDSGISAQALRQLHFYCKTTKALRPRLCVGKARKRPSCFAFGQALNLRVQHIPIPIKLKVKISLQRKVLIEFSR